MSTSLSVVIPTKQGAEQLAGLWPTIENQLLKPDEIIVVEDGPLDEDTEKLLSGKNDTKYISSSTESRGFAPTANAGIRKTSGELIVLVNNDIKLDRNFFKSLVKAAEMKPCVHSFAARIVSMKDRNILESAGDVVPVDFRPRHIGEGAEPGGEMGTDIMGGSAAAAAYRKSFFERVGLFDENFGSYLEDVDLSFRARLKGLKCSSVQGAVAYHLGAATGDGSVGEGQNYDAAWRVRLIARNRLYIVLGDLPTWIIIRLAPWIAGGFFRSMLYHTFVSGSGWAYISGLFDAVRNWSKIREKRRNVMSGRVIENSELLRLIRHNSSRI